MPRFHRVRFTKPKATRATAGRGDTERCLNSPAGHAEYRRRLWEAWTAQSGICNDCHQACSVENSKLKTRTFTRGVLNPMVHKSCPAR
jgi:hypothetical protein